MHDIIHASPHTMPSIIITVALLAFDIWRYRLVQWYLCCAFQRLRLCQCTFICVRNAHMYIILPVETRSLTKNDQLLNMHANLRKKKIIKITLFLPSFECLITLHLCRYICNRFHRATIAQRKQYFTICVDQQTNIQKCIINKIGCVRYGDFSPLSLLPLTRSPMKHGSEAVRYVLYTYCNRRLIFSQFHTSMADFYVSINGRMNSCCLSHLHLHAMIMLTILCVRMRACTGG